MVIKNYFEKSEYIKMKGILSLLIVALTTRSTVAGKLQIYCSMMRSTYIEL